MSFLDYLMKKQRFQSFTRESGVFSRDFLLALRPPLLILGFLAPISLLAWIGDLFTIKGLLVILAVGFYNAGINLLNEWNDQVDDVIKENRTTPVTKCKENSVHIFLMTSFIISLLSVISLAIFYDWIYLIIGFFGLGCGFIYNAWRRKDLFGNVALGVAYASAALAATYPENYLFSLAFALYCISHNIGVQAQDVESDVTLLTVPQQIGVENSMIVVFIVSIFTALVFLELDLLVFFFAPVFIIAGILGYLLYQSKRPIKIFVRGCARIVLLLGFLWMLVSSFI